MPDSVAAAKSSRTWPIWLAATLIILGYALEAHCRRVLVPTGPERSDQGAFLLYAYQFRDRGYSIRADASRMPLFPLAISFLYRNGMSAEEFLRRAQSFNVNLSVVLLVLLFAIFRRSFPDAYALGLLAATAFGLFLRRAPIAQPEVFYYFVAFCAFLLLWRLLVVPKGREAILAGVTLGLAHLAKSSVTPLLLIWSALFTAQTIHLGIVRSWRRLGMLLAVVATFLVVVSPYILASKRTFGRYFYNVNSNFYIWCDTWEEAMVVKAHGDRRGWPKMPEDQLPSAKKYWREHSVAQIGGRIGDGFKILLVRHANEGGHYKFVIFLVLACASIAVWRRRIIGAVFGSHFWASLFCLIFLGCYLLLYAWFSVFSPDNRFVLALFLPFLFIASKVIWALAADREFLLLGRRWAVPMIVTGALLALALHDAAYEGMRFWRLTHTPAKSAAAVLTGPPSLLVSTLL